MHISRCHTVGSQSQSICGIQNFSVWAHIVTLPLDIWFLKVTEHASHSVVFPTQYSLFYCFTLFFPQQFIVVHHSLHTTSASDRPSSYDLHTSEHPVASATPILLLPFFLPCWKRTFVFLTEILASFLFELSHSLLITIDYFWLRFISYSFVRCMLQNWMLCYINLYISLRSIICTFVCSFLKDSLYFESWFNLIWCLKECVVWGKGVFQYYLKIS